MTNATGPWASLLMYESPDLVRRFAKQSVGRSPNAAKAREISTLFAQGREYFRSAAGASELVRPLILYYGVMALARGAVLFLDRSKAKVAATHGLSAAGWGDLLTQPHSLAEAPVRLNSSGTFIELARQSENMERLRVPAEQHPGVASVLSSGTALEPDVQLTIKEILGQIPDVAALYEKTFEEHSRRLRAEVLYTGLPNTDLIHEIAPDENVQRHSWVGVLRPTPALGFPTRGWAENLLASVALGSLDDARDEGFLHFNRGPQAAVYGRTHSMYTDAGSKNEQRLYLPVASSAAGEDYLKLPTDGGIVLSTLLALHLAAYAVGMLARYHPGYWSMLVGRGKGSAVAPVLSAAVSAVEERYPALILEAIE